MIYWLTPDSGHDRRGDGDGLRGAAALLCMLRDRVDGALPDSAPGLKVVAKTMAVIAAVSIDDMLQGKKPRLPVNPAVCEL